MQNLVLSSPFGRLSCIECWSRCIACEGDTNKHRPVSAYPSGALFNCIQCTLVPDAQSMLVRGIASMSR
jgi:hypothetical protein